ISIGCIIVRNYYFIAVDPHVPFQPREVSLGQVLRVPARSRWRKPLAKPIDRRLSDQGHRHLPITNVEIAGPCPVPAQCLMGIEELFHVPPLGKSSSQLLSLFAVHGREERLEVVLLGPLSLPLNVLVERSCLAVLGGVGQLRRCITRPTRPERLRGQFA